MTTDKGKSDLLHGFSDEAEEQQAYREVLDYLVREGRYADTIDADNDASERVRFCEKLDLYADNQRLNIASAYQRKILALIQANQLQEIIAENDGYLPGLDDNDSSEPSLHADTDEILPVVYPDPDQDQGPDSDPDPDPVTSDPGGNPTMDDAHLNSDHARSGNERSGQDRSGHYSAGAAPVAGAAKPAKENAYLYFIRDLGTALGTAIILLAAIRYFFGSEDLLLITKYSFLLWTALLLAFIALLEVSGRLMRRLRYAVSYLFLLATATLSGLLFLQQPWAEDAFHLGSGVQGAINNFIVHKLIAIGPFWLGVLFAEIALLILIVTWLAGLKIRNG